MDEVRLHLGCGKRNIPGFINIDLADFKHIHHKTSIAKLDMFEDNSVDLIYCSHAFEYFDRQEAEKVLDEWYRVLKHGGILRLAVPNFDELAKMHLGYSTPLEKILGPLYGRMEIFTPKRKVIYHKTAYNLPSLKNLLRSKGFIKFHPYDWHETIHKDYDDHSQAYYPHMDKENGLLLSLNVEAVKCKNREEWLKNDAFSSANLMKRKQKREKKLLEELEEKSNKSEERPKKLEKKLEKKDMKYNPWPLGPVPVKWRRPEIKALRKAGYDIKDPRNAVGIFENKMAKFIGSKYAVAVSSCTDALFLCLKYIGVKSSDCVIIPSHTYCSVPMSIIHAGCKVQFEDLEWEGVYQLKPYELYDTSLRFGKKIYIKNSLFCMSFQIKKRLPIGKGGMIFTDDPAAVKWLRVASFEGRHLDTSYDEDQFEMGWNMYMTPEDAARGILIFDQMDKTTKEAGGWMNYPDLSKQEVYK